MLYCLPVEKIKKLCRLQDFLYRHTPECYSAKLISAITLIASPRETKRLLTDLKYIDRNIVSKRGHNGGYYCKPIFARVDIKDYYWRIFVLNNW